MKTLTNLIEVSHGDLDHGHTSLWFGTRADALTAIAEMVKRGETAFIVASPATEREIRFSGLPNGKASPR